MLELWCTSTLIQTLGRGWWPSFPRNLHKGVSKLGYKHTQIVDKTKTILASWNILEYFLPSTISQIISLLHKQFQKKIQNWIFLLFQTACLEATSMDKNSWDTPPPPHIQKNMFHWMHEFFNLQFSHFQLLSPFEVVTIVTLSTERISTLKRGRGGFGYQQQRVFFFNYGRYRRKGIALLKCVKTFVHDCRTNMREHNTIQRKFNLIILNSNWTQTLNGNRWMSLAWNLDLSGGSRGFPW